MATSINDIGQADQNEIESSELLHMSETVPLRQNEKKFDKTALNSVEDLRAALASDVLTTKTPLETFTSPFETPASKKTKSSGRYLEVPLVYCDQTASNRPIRSIEKYMEETCLPLYGNTHTNTSITGSQSTAFVAEARQIVAEATNAKITGKASLDVVLFAGNGATSAVELLVDCLGLQHAAADAGNKRPVVFVGPYEHHSNLLPWRESGCEIVMVPECRETQVVDIVALEKLLQSPEYANRFKMGTFSAASNVNGKVSDVNKIAATLHRHGALAFFDYATGAPYIPINMNPTPSDAYPSASLVAKDAVFISPHKMIGGVGTPGVLILKKNLVQQLNPPHRSGGGTVFYVTNTHHRFLSNRIERYEGGTPNVAGILRTGLTFLFKRNSEEQYMLLHDRLSKEDANSIPDSLLAHEFETYEYVSDTLKRVAPNLILLGDGGAREGTHLPIFSFLIKCGKRFLHYNYVCAILNDVFGIQSRGGCQCSGPYSQRLLGLTTSDEDGAESPNDLNQKIEHALINFKERSELLRPGYTRLSLPFKGLRQEEVEYVVQALEWVAVHGWKLMCQYRCNHRTGEWRHYSRQGKPLGRSERKWLSHYNIIAPPSVETPRTTNTPVTNVKEILDQALANADALLDVVQNDQTNISQALKMNDAGGVLGSDDDGIEGLRWYIYPKEVAKWLSEKIASVPDTESDKLLGAVRPIGVYASENSSVPKEGAAEDANKENGASNSSEGSTLQGIKEDVLSSKFSPFGKKRKRQGIENGHSAPVSLSRTDVSTTGTKKIAPSSFYFKDGEHAGEASYEDIEAGFDGGELSEDCEVFDQEKDEWINISEFLRLSKKSKVENTVSTTNTNEISTSSFHFKDGEHTGDALFEDLEAGFDDGEISENCEVFDVKKDEWFKISEFLRATKEVRNKNTMSTSSMDSVKPEAMCTPKEPNSRESQPIPEANNSSFKDISNEKKKPQRDSSTWGQASFVQPKTVPVSSNDTVKTKDASHLPQATAKIQNGNLALNEAQEDKDASKKEARKKKKGPGVKPPPKMMRMCTQAMIQWDMVKEGDRLLLGLSGGKDSLSLLHCLLEFQRKLPINFTIEVCTIDPMTPSFDPSPLIPYVESLGLKYHYIRDDIVARANSSGKDGKTVSSLCAFCARMKRGNLYTCARKNNCNKLVLAQHLDDCAESFLMSVMHNGFLRTMKAHYEINAGDISVIRPMVYCRESLMTEFAKTANLPVINENCPACFEEPKERARIKKLLSREETLYPNFYDNIRRSLIPLMHEDATAIMRGYTEEAVSKSRKDNSKPRRDNKTKKRKNGGGDQSKVPVEYSPGNNHNHGTVKVEPKVELTTNENGNSLETISDKTKLQKPLQEASEEELLMELARRKAKKFRLAGSSARLETEGDPTGQVCSLNGGDGTIPCRELME